MTNFPITGIDVSRWQREINWSLALSQGISFAFFKVNEGTYAESLRDSAVIDSQFERNMSETARLGMPSSAASPLSQHPPLLQSRQGLEKTGRPRLTQKTCERGCALARTISTTYVPSGSPV